MSATMDIIGRIAAIVTPFVLWQLNRIHKLVNSRMTEVLYTVKSYKDALEGAHVTVPKTPGDGQ